MNLNYLGIINLIFLCIYVIKTEDDGLCSSKCTCKREEASPNLYKLKCGKKDKISSLDEIQLADFAKEISLLDLSDNLLTSFYLKVQLLALQKLDLTKNRLTELENDQFINTPNLRRLDVSENSIKVIGPRAFSGLQHLERLKMSQNQITSISLGTFDPLASLKQLDISNNPLTCDCALLWILEWSQKTSVKLASNPKCMSPTTFKSSPLRKLKIGVNITCRTPAISSGNLPYWIEMRPNVNQVVFEGDSLMIQCKAPSISDSYSASSAIQWTWLDSDPKSYFVDVNIDSEDLQSAGLIDSTLRISELKRNHTGIWSCVWMSIHGNYSRSITVIVISEDTNYCPITTTSDNKGTYMWPRTVVNYTATVTCESPNLSYDVAMQKASYFCTADGRWENLNTSGCAYTSETTRILEQFSKVNSSILESAKHFKNYTSNLKHFVDVMDMVFTVETMENYLRYLPVNQIGGVLIDVVNNLLELSKDYLNKANEMFQVCPKLVNITERLAAGTATSLLHKSNVAVEIFQVKKYGFVGLKCTWYVDVAKSTERLFYCVMNSQVDTSDLRGKAIEASITIPETLFQQIRDTNPTIKYQNILVSMYANGKFFPLGEKSRTKLEVKSAVAGAKLVDHVATNLSDPIFVMLRTPPSSSYYTPTFTPAWWNPALNNGTGDWSADGCKLNYEYQDYVIFYCHNFGYYGLLQSPVVTEKITVGAKFKFSHPAIYLGSFILFTSLLVVVLTYLMCYPAIQMPKKAKHSLINMWIAICILCFMYVFGIYQTEDRQICQIVGMLLHYFTLSSLLWMCVGVNCMYKRLNKNSDVMELQDDELMSEPPIKKPILGLYFVGWGVAIIVCGISAAINIRDYASPTYCFLRKGPPLSALYIPCAILVSFLVIFFLLIRCIIYNLDATGHLSEGTQATENVDLDLLEPNFPNNGDSRSVRSLSSKTLSTEIEDPEHSPSAQLKSYVIFLTLYSLSWLSCAFATSQPYDFVYFEEDLFSIAYAVFATVLSAFTIFFYCVARSDVRSQWVVLGQWLTRRKKFGMVRSRNVSDATAQNLPQIHIQPAVVTSAAAAARGSCLISDGGPYGNSRSSSRSSTSRTKSNSHASNVLQAAAAAAVDLNSCRQVAPQQQLYQQQSEAGAKINNVNLVMLHRQQYRTSVIPHIIENPTSAAEVFYNPHQSIVARKFFKRQKRHQFKRNNLATVRQRDVNSDSASVMSDYRQWKENNQGAGLNQHLFGTNSKVNNTNIHVEHQVQQNNRRQQRKNLNLLSDSTEDLDNVVTSSNTVPVQHLMLNAERLRRREMTKQKTRKKFNVPSAAGTLRTAELAMAAEENNMRSVSQQCTLEYSSENISDSILDSRASPAENKAEGETESQFQEGSLFVPEDDCTFCLEAGADMGDFAARQHARGEEQEQEQEEVSSAEPIMNPSTSSRIYINPSRDVMYFSKQRMKAAQSRASSISASDLDELYQQIRRGPKPAGSMSHSRTFSGGFSKLRKNQAQCLSESDINSYANERAEFVTNISSDNVDNVETTV